MTSGTIGDKKTSSGRFFHSPRNRKASSVHWALFYSFIIKMLGQFYGSFYHDYSKIKNQEYKKNVKEEFFFSNIKIH